MKPFTCCFEPFGFKLSVASGAEKVRYNFALQLAYSQELLLFIHLVKNARFCAIQHIAEAFLPFPHIGERQKRREKATRTMVRQSQRETGRKLYELSFYAHEC
jgi:hypothetical protein